MMLTHVKELIQQNYEKLKSWWPTAPAGIYSAGIGKKEHFYPITYAGIGSVAGCPELFGKLDVIFIDEAHLLSPKETTMYQKFIAYHKQRNPRLMVAGCTATGYRLGQGMLTEPIALPDDTFRQPIFTDVCFDATKMKAFNWFIEQGYLCRLVAPKPKIQIDVSKVGLVGREYNQKQLQAASDKSSLNVSVCEELIDRAYSENRNTWLVFASGIQHVVHIADLLNDMGIKTTHVHSKMGKGERDHNIEAYKAGEYQAMVNNGILTTGFDHPPMDLIADLQATTSSSKHVQKAGRGTRPDYAPGFDLDTQEGRLLAITQSNKPNCLFLDFVGNTGRLGPINDPVIPKPPKAKKQPGDAPIKICPECGNYCHASVRVCGHLHAESEEVIGGCGYEFPKKLNLNVQISEAPIIKEPEKIKVVRYKINHIVYNMHLKQDRPPSIRVSYHCEDFKMFEEFVCLQHPGAAGKKAIQWWMQRHPEKVEPVDCNGNISTAVAIGMIDKLIEPKEVDVWVNKHKGGKYPEIINYVY
jgi:DNA repair protein RadD